MQKPNKGLGEFKRFGNSYFALAIILVSFLPLFAAAQMPAKHQKINYSYTWPSGQFQSGLYLPDDTIALAPSDTNRIAIKRGLVYISYKNGAIASWKLAGGLSGGSGSPDTTYFENGPYSTRLDTLLRQVDPKTFRWKSIGTDMPPAYKSVGNDSILFQVRRWVTDSSLFKIGNQSFLGNKAFSTISPDSIISSSGSSYWYYGGNKGWAMSQEGTTANRPTLATDVTWLRWNEDSSRFEAGDLSMGWRGLAYTGEGGSGGGGFWDGLFGGSMPFSTNTTISGSPFNEYVFTGSSPATLTLPSIGSSATRVFFIKNQGSATLTVASAGANEIFNTSLVSSFTMSVGAGWILANDGTYWNLYAQGGGGGSGTVTSVATGYGLTGGTITSSGTLKADSNSLATRAVLYKVADSTFAAINRVLPMNASTGNVLRKSAGGGLYGNAAFSIDSATNIFTVDQLNFVTTKTTTANKNKKSTFSFLGSGNEYESEIDSVWNGSAWITGGPGMAYGYQAGRSSTGTRFTGFGRQTGFLNTGGNVSAFGYLAGYSNTGASSVFMGENSGASNTGSSSVGIGYFALSNNTGARATAIGLSAGSSNTGADVNFHGETSGSNNRGNYVDGFGRYAAAQNIADYSAGFGHSVLRYNNWLYRTSIGYGAGSTWVIGNSKAFTNANVSGTTITITSHGFGSNGTYVNLKFTNISGTSPGGLITGNTYQFLIASANTLTLSTLSSTGSGSFTLEKDVDKTNAIELGYNATAEKANQAILGTAATISETRLFGALKFDSFSSRRVIIEGDSYSNNTSTSWWVYVPDSSAYFGKASFKTYASAGNTSTDMVSQYATQAHTDAVTSGGTDYWFWCYAGVNDIINGLAATTTYSNLKTLWANAKADGFRVGAFTVLKVPLFTAPQIAKMDSINNLIKSDASLYDYLFDWNASIDFTINTSFTSDGTHPSVTGAKYMANFISQTYGAMPYTLSKVSKDSTGVKAWNMKLNPAGKVAVNKLDIDKSSGSDAVIGTATLVGGTITVNTTAVTANSKIFISRNTTGGTLGHLSVPTASITAGTSFVINSSSGTETSTVNWWIVN